MVLISAFFVTQTIHETGDFKYIHLCVPKYFYSYAVLIVYSALDGTCWENRVILTLLILFVKWFEANFRSRAFIPVE